MMHGRQSLVQAMPPTLTHARRDKQQAATATRITARERLGGQPVCELAAEKGIGLTGGVVNVGSTSIGRAVIRSL